MASEISIKEPVAAASAGTTYAPPVSTPGKQLLKEVGGGDIEPVATKNDGFDGTTVRNPGWRFRSPGPEAVVNGPVPPGDRPLSRTDTALRMTGATLGLGALGGGLAIAAATGPVGIFLGLLLALAGLIAMVVCVRAQHHAEEAVNVSGLNTKTFSDFSGQVHNTPKYFDLPRNGDEVAQTMLSADHFQEHLKPQGSRHSFVGTWATDGHLMSLERMNWMQVTDREQKLVTVGAGAKIKDIKEFLATQGLAFENLGGITEQALIGAIKTGTHGSSGKYGIIATQVQSMRMMLLPPLGPKMVTLSKTENPELFSAALVDPAGLGVVIDFTIKARKAFNLKEVVTKTTFEDAFKKENILRRLAEHDYHQVVWMPHAWDAYVVDRDETTEKADPEFSHATPVAPLSERIPENLGLSLTKVQALRPLAMKIASGTQPDVDVHVGRSDLILSRPLPPQQRELEAAFSLDEEDPLEVMKGLQAEIDRAGLKMNFPCSMRFVKADDILMSPANRGPGTKMNFYISVLLQGDTPADDRVMQVIQRYFKSKNGRPHWGKENDQFNAQDMRDSYGDRYEKYVDYLNNLDSHGLMRNHYSDRLFPDHMQSTWPTKKP